MGGVRAPLLAVAGTGGTCDCSGKNMCGLVVATLSYLLFLSVLGKSVLSLTVLL